MVTERLAAKKCDPLVAGNVEVVVENVASVEAEVASVEAEVADLVGDQGEPVEVLLTDLWSMTRIRMAKSPLANFRNEWLVSWSVRIRMAMER
jgi:hypothetical protein